MLQTTDSLFPTGAYAHSFGLEGAVQEGLVSDPESFEAFLNQIIIPSLSHQELPAVFHAYQAVIAKDLKKLQELDEIYGALKMSPEVRTASQKIGSQRLALVAGLLPDPLWAQLEQLRKDAGFQAHEAIILGAQGAISQSDASSSMMAAFYLGLASQMNAVFKLIRIGQKQCQTILSRCLAQADEVTKLAQTILMDDIGWFAPSLEIVNARHETAYTRIFIS